MGTYPFEQSWMPPSRPVAQLISTHLLPSMSSRRVGGQSNVHRAGSGCPRSFGPTEIPGNQMVSSLSSSSRSSSLVGKGGRYHDVCAFGAVRCGAVLFGRRGRVSLGTRRKATECLRACKGEFVGRWYYSSTRFQDDDSDDNSESRMGSGCCCSRWKWGTSHRSSPLSLELACRALQWDDIVSITRRSQVAECVEKGPVESGVRRRRASIAPLRGDLPRSNRYYYNCRCMIYALPRGNNTHPPDLDPPPAPTSTATMSRASKLTLLGTSLFAAGTVTFVHWQQRSEKDVCTNHPHSLPFRTTLTSPPPQPGHAPRRDPRHGAAARQARAAA